MYVPQHPTDEDVVKNVYPTAFARRNKSGRVYIFYTIETKCYCTSCRKVIYRDTLSPEILGSGLNHRTTWKSAIKWIRKEGLCPENL